MPEKPKRGEKLYNDFFNKQDQNPKLAPLCNPPTVIPYSLKIGTLKKPPFYVIHTPQYKALDGDGDVVYTLYISEVELIPIKNNTTHNI